MYASVLEIGQGFFGIVCASDDRPHVTSDPPPTASQSRNDSCDGQILTGTSFNHASVGARRLVNWHHTH